MTPTSLLRGVERLAVAHLPPSVKSALRRLKERLPLKLQQSAPVVQIYLNDGATRSFVGAHNFFSCLQSELRTEALLELTFHSPSGRVLLRHREPMAHLAARAVDVQALLAQRGIDSPFGIVTAQLTPTHPRRRAYRALGAVSAQVFVFYCDDRGSVAQIHPLSTTDPGNASSGAWSSSQLVCTDGLTALELIQCNPRAEAHAMEHRLLDSDTGAVVASARSQLAAMGVCRLRFPLDGTGHGRLRIALDNLPSANAKPMVRREFAGGIFSMSHG